MNTEREQKTKNRLKPTIKNFIEDNAIKQDHKIDLQNYKKKNKNTKKTSKKDPIKFNKSIIFFIGKFSKKRKTRNLQSK